MLVPWRYRPSLMDDKSNNLEATLAKLSHDLRTPLSVIHTTTNLLLNPKYKFTEEQVREQHERIQRNVEVMNRLIGELAGLAKGPTETPGGDSIHVDGA